MSEAPPALKVLVVDDSELSRSVIRRLLERQGYAVATAGDGAEGAVVALRELPDAVVTDLEMPVMDGYQLARLLKSDPATRDVPVLILTSHDEASSRFWGLETGADAYLIKDELTTGLVAAVARLLEKPRDKCEREGEPPQTPLDVLARVSSHLDARLLEAVLVNRTLERGMQAEGIREATHAIFRTVGELVDPQLLALAVCEPEAATVYLRALSPVDPGSRIEVVEEMLSRIGVAPDLPREVHLDAPGGEGAHLTSGSLELFALPLRGAKGLLAVAPRRPFGEESRDRMLLAELTGHLALVLDNARLAQRLRELSMIDGLTRLLNRRTVNQRLTEEVERARRYALPLSIVLCDIDHFKQVNDTWGHQAGDMVLVHVAEIFRQEARTADVVGRFGGEEFLLLLPNTDLDHTARAARRLLQSIGGSRFELPSGEVLRVTASIGAAALVELGDAPTPEALLALADRRLYEAKAAGRNRAIP